MLPEESQSVVGVVGTLQAQLRQIIPIAMMLMDEGDAEKSDIGVVINGITRL